MKQIAPLLALLVCGQILAQAELNDYKYFIVPKQFKVLKKPNEFKTSTLVKYLLVQNGMEGVYEDVQPAELIMNPCMAVQVELIDEKKFLNTQLSLQFLDCNKKEIYRTPLRKSSKKDFIEAYDDAIRKTFSPIAAMTYAYRGPQSPPVAEANDEVPQAPEKPLQPPVVQKPSEATTTPPPPPPPPQNKLRANFKDDVVRLPEAQLVAVKEGDAYKVLNEKQEVIFYLSATLKPDVYLMQRSEQRGLVFKSKGKWFMERLMDSGKHKVEWIEISFQN